MKPTKIIKHEDGTTEHIYGTINVRMFFDSDNKLHRSGDRPAVTIGKGKSQLAEWFKHGERHRIGKPAVIEANYIEYWENGKKLRRVQTHEPCD
jgi:hypothetical protein